MNLDLMEAIWIQHVFQQTPSNKNKTFMHNHPYLSNTLMPCHNVQVQDSQKYLSRLHSAHQGNGRWSRLNNRNSSWLQLERSMLPSCSFKNKQLHLPSDPQKWGLKKLFYHQNYSMWSYKTLILNGYARVFNCHQKIKQNSPSKIALLHSVTWSSSC